METGGYLLIEVGQGQAEQVRMELEAQSQWSVQSLRKDHGGIPRVVVLQKL